EAVWARPVLERRQGWRGIDRLPAREAALRRAQARSPHRHFHGFEDAEAEWVRCSEMAEETPGLRSDPHHYVVRLGARAGWAQSISVGRERLLYQSNELW